MRPGELIHQTSGSTGTGNFALSVVNGKQSFVAAYGANQFEYYISNRDAPEWEYGRGTITGGALVRTTPIKSSSGAATLCPFSAGVKDVASDYPSNGIDNASLTQMPAGFKGRDAGTGDVQDLTPAQARTLLNVADGANNYIPPNHTGDVTSTGDGATVITNKAVVNVKLADMDFGFLKGRITAGTGTPENLNADQVRSILNVAEGANAYIHPNHFGDVTSTGDGGTAIGDHKVLNLMLAQMPANTIKGNDTGAVGDAKDLTVFQAATLLNAVTKTGNHTMSGNLTLPILYANTVYAGASQTTYMAENTATVSSPAGSAIIQAIKNVASGFSALFRGLTTGKTRWAMHLGDTVAESGANNSIGSNFNLQAADDAGIKFSVMYAYRETGNVTFWNDVTAGNNLIGTGVNAGTGGIVSVGPVSSVGKIGYSAGSAVVQATGKATAVTCNALTGYIQMHAESLAANTTVTFQLNNSKITTSLDHIIAHHKATGSFGSYVIAARTTAAGTALVSVRNISAAALGEGITIAFFVFQGSTTGALGLMAEDVEGAGELSHDDKMRLLLPPEAFELPPDVPAEYVPLAPVGEK